MELTQAEKDRIVALQQKPQPTAAESAELKALVHKRDKE